MSEAIANEDSTQPPQQRKVLLIDPQYQLREVGRNITQFTILLVIQLACFGLIGYLGREGVLRETLLPLLFVAVAFCAPVILCILYSLTTIRRTHKVAGAAFRLTSDIPRILSDPSFRFHLREGDYLMEMKEELNKVIEAVEARGKSLLVLEENLHDLEQALSSLHGKLTVEESASIEKCRTRSCEALEVLRNRVDSAGESAKEDLRGLEDDEKTRSDREDG